MSLPETSTKTVHLAALKCAALLVPTHQRPEWLQEWTSELWYVHQACMTDWGPSWQAERAIASFCLGAFNDAICLRRNTPRTKSPKAHPLHSAAQCALFLTILAATTWCLALLLPGVRTAVQPTPYRDTHNLIAISADGRSETPVPTISAEQYRSWRNRTQHLFSDFAFYQTSIKLLHIAPHQAPQLSVARASSNLFDLLGVSPSFATQPAHDGIPHTRPERKTLAHYLQCRPRDHRPHPQARPAPRQSRRHPSRRLLATPRQSRRLAARARRSRRRNPRNHSRIRHRPPRSVILANSHCRNLASLHSPTRRQASQLRLRLPRRSHAGHLRYLYLHSLPRSSRPTRHHFAPSRRVPRQSPPPPLVHQAAPLDLPLEQARSHPAHRLFWIPRHRPLQHIHHTGSLSVSPGHQLLLRAPLRFPLDPPRSTEALPRLSASAD